MKDSARSRWSRFVTATVLSLPVFLVLFALPGCDIVGGDDGMEGVWEATGDDVVYLNVAKDLITSYDFQGDSYDEGEDCYEIESLAVTSRDGDTWKARVDFFGEPLDVTLGMNGDRLTVSVFGESETFKRSSRKVSQFTPECTD